MVIVSKYLSDFFSSKLEINKKEEDWKSFLLNGEFVESISVPHFSIARNIFESIHDSFEINIKIGNQDAITLYSGNLDDEDFYEELEDSIDYLEKDEKIFFAFEIHKRIKDNILRIYDSELFFKKLNSYSLNGLIFLFSDLLKTNEPLRLYNLNDNSSFETESIICSNNFEALELKKIEFNRNELFNKTVEICHFSENEKYKFTPNDFKIKTRVGFTDELNCFHKLSLLMAISFIFDISSLNYKEDNIFLKLNGYKALTFDITFKQLPIIYLESYFKIYSWIYSEKNISDKVGLARNLMSIHLKDKSSLKIDGNIMNSLHSGYKIYLKENVKQYIDIRSKISSELITISDKATEIGEKFINNGSVTNVRLVVQD